MTTTFNILINYCSHNIGSSVHQSPARICAKFRLKKSRWIKPWRVLSLPFRQEKIQQSNIHIPKIEDILIMCIWILWLNVGILPKTLEIYFRFVVRSLNFDKILIADFPTNNMARQRNTHRGDSTVVGLIGVPSSSASLRQRWSSILQAQGSASAHNGLPKQVGGWIHTMPITDSRKGLYNEVGNQCPTFLRKKKHTVHSTWHTWLLSRIST